MFFFFSSRRRHTRCSRDWSSDVCSSDLRPAGEQGRGAAARPGDALADRQGATSYREATLSFARRVREIEPFLAVEMGERAQALERSGVDVVHFEFGEPDLEAPAGIPEAGED